MLVDEVRLCFQPSLSVFSRRSLESILSDQRYQKSKPILFTTNKALKQWGRVLHDEELAHAILDRTLHYGEHIKLIGPSYRLRGRKLEWDEPTAKEG